MNSSCNYLLSLNSIAQFTLKNVSFMLDIPLSVQSLSRTERGGREQGLTMQQKRYRVLIVDDEAGIRKILRLFLELEGYSVYEAITATQAVSVIQKERPDLVILDVILCGQTGFEMCEWMKNNPETRDIIVFLFTALNQEHDLEEGKRVRCDLYLTKPQNPKDIVEKVKEYLGKKAPVNSAS
jgi:twitching motility two-component system response regulator PilH